MRDLAELGESTLTLWAAHAGITPQRVFKDKNGWDCLLEFPMQQRFQGQPFDKIQSPISCYVQVKASDKSNPKFSVKLSNWLRMVLDPRPAFFLILEFAKKQECTNAYLFHCGHNEIADVLKRCRKLGDSKDLSILSHIKKVVPIRDIDRLQKLDGTELAKRIKSTIGPSFDEYQKNKIAYRESVGYEIENTKFHFSLVGDQESNPTEKLLDLFLGKQNSLPIRNLEIFDLRFGIPAPNPHTKSSSGEIQISSIRTDNLATLALTNLTTKKTLALDLTVYFPYGLPLDFPGLKLRLASKLIEIEVPINSSAEPKFNFKYPPSNENYSISELAQVSEMILFLSDQRANDSFDLKITHQGNRLAYGQISFPAVFSPETLRVAQGILDAKEISHVHSFDDLNVSIDQIFQQALELQFIAQANKNDHSYIKISFSSSEEFSYDKTYVIPRLQLVHIGHLRFCYCIAIFATPIEIIHEDHELNRINMTSSKFIIHKSFVLTDSIKTTFDHNSLIDQIGEAFKNIYDIVYLQE